MRGGRIGNVKCRWGIVNMGDRLGIIHVEKSVSLYHPDLIYNYSEALMECDYVVVHEGAILCVEELSKAEEWLKRSTHVRLWAPLVFWSKLPAQKVPHLALYPQELEALERIWKEYEHFSLLSRDVASELLVLANFSALALSGEAAKVVLRDICSLCQLPFDEYAVAAGGYYVRLLALAYRLGIGDESARPDEYAKEREALRSIKVGEQKSLKDILEPIRDEVNAILFLPRGIWLEREDRMPLSVEKQASLAGKLSDIFPGRPIVIVSNERIRRQCEMIKERLRSPHVDVKIIDITEIQRDIDHVRRKLLKEKLRNRRLLTVVADDYDKSMVFRLLLLLDELKNSIYLLDVPGVKLRRAEAPCATGRLDEMAWLWEKDPSKILEHEVILLEPKEVEVAVKMLQRCQ